MLNCLIFILLIIDIVGFGKILFFSFQYPKNIWITTTCILFRIGRLMLQNSNRFNNIYTWYSQGHYSYKWLTTRFIIMVNHNQVIILKLDHYFCTNVLSTYMYKCKRLYYILYPFSKYLPETSQTFNSNVNKTTSDGQQNFS